MTLTDFLVALEIIVLVVLLLIKAKRMLAIKQQNQHKSSTVSSLLLRSPSIHSIPTTPNSPPTYVPRTGSLLSRDQRWQQQLLLRSGRVIHESPGYSNEVSHRRRANSLGSSYHQSGAKQTSLLHRRLPLPNTPLRAIRSGEYLHFERSNPAKDFIRGRRFITDTEEEEQEVAFTQVQSDRSAEPAPAEQPVRPFDQSFGAQQLQLQQQQPFKLPPMQQTMPAFATYTITTTTTTTTHTRPHTTPQPSFIQPMAFNKQQQRQPQQQWLKTPPKPAPLTIRTPKTPEVFVGPRGGKYYFTSSGSKRYLSQDAGRWSK